MLTSAKCVAGCVNGVGCTLAPRDGGSRRWGKPRGNSQRRMMLVETRHNVVVGPFVRGLDEISSLVLLARALAYLGNVSVIPRVRRVSAVV